MIQFSSSMDATQCVSVNIRGDNLVEGNEEFRVTFSSDNERDEIVENTTVVTIIDDDGKFQ